MEHTSQYRCIQRVLITPQTTVEKVLENARRNPGAWDGICISTFANIGELPEEAERRFQHVAQSLRALRDAGHRVQLGMSFTLGHGDSTLGPEPSVPPMVGPGGEVCRRSICPRSAEARESLCAMFRRYGALQPECLWIDDDFRLFNHSPATCGCFCPDCVAQFNQEQGTRYTREALVAALLEDHFPQENALRQAWLAFNHNALLSLAGALARAVRAVAPDTILGLMTAGAEYNLYDLPEYHDFLPALANARGKVWFRPGAFFYDDETPFEAVRKAFALSVTNQCSVAPGVKTYSEIVICPYVKRAKSLKITRFEALLHIGLGGVNGLTFEAIKDMIDEMDAYLTMMQANTPLLRALADAIAGRIQTGFYPWFSPLDWAYHDSGDRMEDLQKPVGAPYDELLRIGVPLTANPQGALGLILAGSAPKSMPETELRNWLGRGLYADSEAAAWISRRLGRHALGVKVQKEAIPSDETFCVHALNGSYAGFFRRAHFGMSQRMEVDGATALSHTAVGSVGTAIYTTSEGGRAAVLAANPWSKDIRSFAKSEQILRILDWLCDGLPVRVHSDCRVGLSLWRGEKDWVLFLFNMDFDPARSVRLSFQQPMHIEQLAASGDWVPTGEGAEWTVPVLADFDCAAFRLTPLVQ